METLIAEAMAYNTAKYGRADRLTGIHTARAAAMGVAAMARTLGKHRLLCRCESDLMPCASL